MKEGAGLSHIKYNLHVFLVDYGADRLDYGEWNFQNVSFKERLEAFV